MSEVNFRRMVDDESQFMYWVSRSHPNEKVRIGGAGNGRGFVTSAARLTRDVRQMLDEIDHLRTERDRYKSLSMTLSDVALSLTHGAQEA